MYILVNQIRDLLLKPVNSFQDEVLQILNTYLAQTIVKKMESS